MEGCSSTHHLLFNQKILVSYQILVDGMGSEAKHKCPKVAMKGGGGQAYWYNVLESVFLKAFLNKAEALCGLIYMSNET